LGQFAIEMLGSRGAALAKLVAGLDERQRKRRNQRATELLLGAVDDVGADTLAERVRDDEAFEDLVLGAVAGAVDARDSAKRRALRRVLVAGARDGARVDEQHLILDVLADLEAPHVHVLVTLGEINETSRRPFPPTASPVALSPQELRARIPGHTHVLDAVLARLAGAGLIIDA
jgi:hypothetical protein